MVAKSIDDVCYDRIELVEIDFLIVERFNLQPVNPNAYAQTKVVDVKAKLYVANTTGLVPLHVVQLNTVIRSPYVKFDEEFPCVPPNSEERLRIRGTHEQLSPFN